MFLRLIFISSLLLLQNVYAKEVAGITFAEQIKAASSQQTLVLNGAGIRYKFIFKIYAAALYVEQPTQTADSILNHSGQKLLTLHILYDEIEKQAMIDAYIDGFKSNLNDDEYKALESKINQLISLQKDYTTGDTLSFDYQPNKGTDIIINEQLQGTIQGSDFNKALLQIWIGKKPATNSLKNKLLGKK
ncbi:MAG: chalcone isomerase family protein [Gammaproteobacteria bacterium]|nr:chalcone isomerase family protein [Gammaproteobacteria bacterium]